MSAAVLLCPARRRSPSIEGSMGPLPPTSPTLAAVSREVVMGTVCCRYPSAWVPLLTWRGGGDSGSRASSACVLTRAKQSGQRGHRAPRGGPSLCGCSGDAGGTQRWRSPTCPHPPHKRPEHPCGPGTGNGAGRWAQAPWEQCGRAPAPAAVLPAHSHGEPALPVLPRPTRPAMEPAARSPVTLRDFNPAAPTGCNRMGAGTHPGTRCVPWAEGRICPRCWSRQSWWRRERLGWQPAESRRGPAVPGPGCMPAAGKVTLHGHPAPPTHTTHPERGTQVPIPAPAQHRAAVPIPPVPHSNPGPPSPIPALPCESLTLHPLSLLDPTAP